MTEEPQRSGSACRCDLFAYEQAHSQLGAKQQNSQIEKNTIHQEFRDAFVSYLEWGSRIALAVSHCGIEIYEDLDPMPQWDWIVKPLQDPTS